ncbi:MAG: CotH kinase family protein [Paludibacter sp.]|nr:CotH kinase family protein [Paludibacter sp.]
MKNHIIRLFLPALVFQLLFVSEASAQVQVSNIPSIYINTTNNAAVVDKTTWIPGIITVVSNDTTESLDMATEIRGRGNSTWLLDKKPYRVKLDKKTNLLNMPAHLKNWVFLSNHADKTLIRNALAFKIGALLGFEFTPAGRFVDFTLNNDFLGNYFITDQIEVNPGRVDIDEQDSSVVSEPDITGGYLLEIDGFASSEPVWFTSGKGLKISVKSPDDDDINDAQLTYIQTYIADFESRLFSDDFTDPELGYRAHVDTTSLINWYIACELTGNSDSFWSTYVYKKRNDDKLYFGPMWDYDIAFNNDDRLGDATKNLMSNVAHDPKTWIKQFLSDEWFVKAVLRHWQQFEAQNLNAVLNSYINETVQLIDQSQQLNYNRWPVLDQKIYRETYLFSTYAEGVDYLKTYIANRILFLNDAFANMVPESPSIPFVPQSNVYYMIMNRKTSNVIDVDNNSVSSGGKMVLWEAIENENAQLWQIRQINDSLFRIINKNSGLAMAGNGKNNNLIQVAVNDRDNTQKWKVVPVNTGNIYGFVNYASGYAIDNSGGSYVNGNEIIEWNNQVTSNENQQWYIKPELVVAGINNAMTAELNVDIYPNPASEKLSVRFTPLISANYQIQIYDITGSCRLTTENYAMESDLQVVTLNVSDLSDGIYFVKLSNGKSEPVIRRFVKK